MISTMGKNKTKKGENKELLFKLHSTLSIRK